MPAIRPLKFDVSPMVAAQHGDGERGLPVQVGRIDVGAELDQEIEDVVALTADGHVERRQPALES